MVSEFFFPAFLAGLLMFFAPCSLPFVPAFLGVIGGAASQDGAVITRAARLRARLVLVGNAILFTAGFSAIFLLFGTAAGWGGQFLFPFRENLIRVSGVFVIVLGFSLLGVFRLPIFRATQSFRLTIPHVRSRPLTSFLVGVAFGTGWTPCVGPILGAVLTFAAASGTVASGAVLLGVFSVGLSLPFILTAAALGWASPWIRRISHAGRIIEGISGALLVLFGYLLFSQQLGRVVGFGFRLFEFFDYDRLLQYL